MKLERIISDAQNNIFIGTALDYIESLFKTFATGIP